MFCIAVHRYYEPNQLRVTTEAYLTCAVAIFIYLTWSHLFNRAEQDQINYDNEKYSVNEDLQKSQHKNDAYNMKDSEEDAAIKQHDTEILVGNSFGVEDNRKIKSLESAQVKFGERDTVHNSSSFKPKDWLETKWLKIAGRKIDWQDIQYMVPYPIALVATIF
ncbi:unnamed protein product [Protopolystoma xenopodis]|uniref:Uncharacterized protein n=1 Tax=Protopolystoma xenopodis TaxID=117903 RepID=A0A3S5FC02_9PLAT|nr:unnamed protein product [Protopolystoma xenopodis]